MRGQERRERRGERTGEVRGQERRERRGETKELRQEEYSGVEYSIAHHGNVQIKRI